MVEIQSKEVVDKVSEELKIQPAFAVPRNLANNIQLVYDVQPKREIIVKLANASDTGLQTIFTTSTDKDTWVTAIRVSIAKDAVNDSTFTSVTGFTPDKPSAATNLFRLNYEPTTAQNINDSIVFNHPIKLLPGTAVQVTAGSATASIDMLVQLYIYETDPQ